MWITIFQWRSQKKLITGIYVLSAGRASPESEGRRFEPTIPIEEPNSFRFFSQFFRLGLTVGHALHSTIAYLFNSNSSSKVVGILHCNKPFSFSSVRRFSKVLIIPMKAKDRREQIDTKHVWLTNFRLLMMEKREVFSTKKMDINDWGDRHQVRKIPIVKKKNQINTMWLQWGWMPYEYHFAAICSLDASLFIHK